MNKFNRLKMEIYNKEISGNNWPVAFCGYDSNIGKEVAVVTDHVRASECKGTALEYAQLFMTAPKLLEKLEKLADAFYFHAPDSVLSQEEKLLNEVSDIINEARGINK